MIINPPSCHQSPTPPHIWCLRLDTLNSGDATQVAPRRRGEFAIHRYLLYISDLKPQCCVTAVHVFIGSPIVPFIRCSTATMLQVIVLEACGQDGPCPSLNRCAYIQHLPQQVSILCPCAERVTFSTRSSSVRLYHSLFAHI